MTKTVKDILEEFDRMSRGKQNEVIQEFPPGHGNEGAKADQENESNKLRRILETQKKISASATRKRENNGK